MLDFLRPGQWVGIYGEPHIDVAFCHVMFGHVLPSLHAIFLLLPLPHGPIYTQQSLWWWESTKDGHVSTQLFKEKVTSQKFFDKTKCDPNKTKGKQIWQGGGLQVQKISMVNETRGRWWA